MTTPAEFWAVGDYARVAALIEPMGRQLVAAAGVRRGHRVLDVAAGTGNASLPAAATGAEVVATDITPQLLAVGERAAALDADLVALLAGENAGAPGGPGGYRYEYLLVLARAPVSPPTTRTGAAAAAG